MTESGPNSPNGAAQQDNDEAIEAMKKSGKTEMGRADRRAERRLGRKGARARSTPTWKGRVGKEILAEFKKEAGGGGANALIEGCSCGLRTLRLN